MLAFAEAEIRLGKRQEDKATLREHLTSMWRQSGVKPEALNVPPLPPLAAHLWVWFVDLDSERGTNGMGASRITSGAIRDWSWATGNQLELWERTALRKLDALWLKEQSNDS